MCEASLTTPPCTRCAPAKNAYVIPQHLSLSSASIIEPFAVAANVTSRTGVLPSDMALVYGAGPVGLNLLQVLKRVYSLKVFITDHLDERLKLALACGASEGELINTSRESCKVLLDFGGQS